MANSRAIPVELTEEERQILEGYVRRRKTAQVLAMRSRIVLLASEGMPNKAIAAKLGTSRSTVMTWRKRFVERRLDGLHDEPRPGAPRSITDADVERSSP